MSTTSIQPRSSVSAPMTPSTVSVLLVDDDARFRQGLQTLLNFYSNHGPCRFQIVGEAVSSDQTLQVAAQQHPALILLDMELHQGDGIHTLLRLKEMAYKGKVLVLSAHYEDDWIFRAMQAGACGYVVKDRLPTQLCEAISTVMRGEVYLSSEVATGFFRLFNFYSGRSIQMRQSIHLTEREQEVLQWLVQGASNEEIAEQLFITIATVKAHLTAIFEKLTVTSRTQAIVKALKLGLVCA